MFSPTYDSGCSGKIASRSRLGGDLAIGDDFSEGTGERLFLATNA
jgi:hypothetical protein